MAALFVGAVFVLGVKLLKPASIHVFVEGTESAVSVIPGFFTSFDVLLILISSIVLGASAMYLVTINALLEAPRAESNSRGEHTPKDLKEDELVVYEIVMEGDGMVFQSEIVEKTGFPKAKVSRCLDALENRGLLERRRKGMSNMVVLK